MSRSETAACIATETKKCKNLQKEGGISVGADDQTARLLNRLKHEFIIPEVRLRKGQIGKLIYMDILCVENDIQYKTREDIIRLFDRGIAHILRNYKKSNYYKYQTAHKKRSSRDALKKIFRYYLLYRSIKKKGFMVDGKNLESFPWIFASRRFFVRLDGHHRASVARFLGHKELPVLLITPKNIAALPNLPAETAEFIGKLGEPKMVQIRPFDQVINN